MTAGRSTRTEVLELLRKRRAATADDISGELHITPNAVRQHLTQLERAGLVNSTPLRQKRGRPALMFSLTSRADALFPKRDGQLASMILSELQELSGPEGVDELFRRVALRRAVSLRPQLQGLSFKEQLDRLVAWIGRAGTLAEYEEGNDAVTVTIHNCPFRNTALKFPQVCGITPHLLSDLLGTPVSQATSIHRRDPHCSFVLERPSAAGAD
jgi:predicted ArsR family transcriptional regulator